MRKSSITMTVPAVLLGKFMEHCEKNELDPNLIFGELIEEYLKREGVIEND